MPNSKARTNSQLIMNIYADIQVLKAKVNQHDKLLYAILSSVVGILLKLFLF